MKKTRIKVKVSALQLNTGQLGWLPKNPRQWTQEDIDKMCESLRRDPDFMEDNPLDITPAPQEGQFVVFCGNLRTTGLGIVGVEETDAYLYIPEKKPDPDPACHGKSFAEDRETIRRRAILDNGHFGSWDSDTAAEWGYEAADLAGFGVPGYVYGDAVENPGNGSGPGGGDDHHAKEDDFDENTDEIHVRCKPGDIWQLGGHRLMCGDSVDLQQVKALMGGARADMVFTDPPYGVAIGDKNKLLKEAVGGSNAITENIANDTLSVDELYKVLQAAMENCRESCKDDASYYVCAPPGGDMGLMMMMMRDAGLNVRHQIVWNKNCATFSLGRLDYDYKHEAIMYTWTKSHHNYRNGQFRTSVWDVNKPMHNDLHPTMKPIELVEAAMKDATLEGDLVLDLFGGSGTTLVTAEQLGRKCYTMEIDPHYCDVIIARWEKLTGKTATKIES